MNWNLLTVILGAPFFFALIMASNWQQEVNIIQAFGRHPDSARRRIKSPMSGNLNYKRSHRVLFGMVPVSLVAAAGHLAGVGAVVAAGAFACLILLAVAIAFRAAGFEQLLKQYVSRTHA